MQILFVFVNMHMHDYIIVRMYRYVLNNCADLPLMLCSYRTVGQLCSMLPRKAMLKLFCYYWKQVPTLNTETQSVFRSQLFYAYSFVDSTVAVFAPVL